MSLYVGIDPGMSGATVVIDHERHLVMSWAADARDDGYFRAGFDGRAYTQALSNYPAALVVIETPFALRAGGTANALTTGVRWGRLREALHQAGLPVKEVTPASWSIKMIGTPPKGGWPPKEKKRRACMLARERLPSLSLVLPGRRVEHDGLAEAGLLALYGLEHLSHGA